MGDVVVTLVGVAAGFALSEVKSYISARRSKSGLVIALNHELNSMLRLIPSKKDVLRQAKKAYLSAQILPTSTTKAPRQIYDRIVLSNPDLLSPQQRDILHVVYERMRIIDESMDSIERRFNEIVSAHDLGSAINAASASISDLESALDDTGLILSQYLNGELIDVYELGNSANKAKQ